MVINRLVHFQKWNLKAALGRIGCRHRNKNFYINMNKSLNKHHGPKIGGNEWEKYNLNNKILVLIFLLILILAVLVSVLADNRSNSGNETLLMQYSLPQLNSEQRFNEQNITLPSGTRSVRVEYQNISIDDSRPTSAILRVYYLNAVPAFTEGFNVTQFEENHYLYGNVLYLTSKSKNLSGNFTYSNSNLKALVIRDDNLKPGGTIKVYVRV